MEVLIGRLMIYSTEEYKQFYGDKVCDFEGFVLRRVR